MKVFKIISVAIVSLLLTASVMAQDEIQPEKKSDDSQKIFGMDFGFGCSIGFPNVSNLDSTNQSLATLTTFRLDIPLDFRFNILSWFSLGVESGVSLFYNAYSMQTNKDYVLLDVPVRGFLRFGTENFWAQAFGGYYFCIITPLGKKNVLDENGAEAGIRFNLKFIYLQASYVFSYSPHFRVGFGGMYRIF